MKDVSPAQQASVIPNSRSSLPTSSSIAHRPSSGTPLLSIIIPLYNHLALTQAMLASLTETMPTEIDFEVIFVDDGSSDGTREWLASLADPRIHVLLNDRNLGYAGSNNRGAKLARGTYLGLLNNDLVLKPGWLEPMLSVIERHGSKVGLVGNVQERFADRGIDHSGIAVTNRAKLVHLQDIPAQDERPCLAVTAACCLLLREDFLAVGGFDEVFRNGGEDVDLAFKLKKQGKSCIVALTSRVRHHVSASRVTSSVQDEKNSRLLCQRWGDELQQSIARHWANTNTPSEAALLARSALWREEARWQSLFGEAQEQTPRVLEIKGFKASAPGSPSFLVGSASVRLSTGFPKRNLALCGHLDSDEALAPSLRQKLGLELRINRIQTVTFSPIPLGNFNLCIDTPASLPDRETLIEIRLLGPRSLALLKPVASLLALLPLPASLKHPLEDLAKLRLFKRLRLSALVVDDHPLLDLHQPVKAT